MDKYERNFNFSVFIYRLALAHLNKKSLIHLSTTKIFRTGFHLPSISYHRLRGQLFALLLLALRFPRRQDYHRTPKRIVRTIQIDLIFCENKMMKEKNEQNQ